MGYLPGMLWILAGVVLAGAVQDFMILFISMRRDGRSLGELIRAELGVIPGVIALFGTFMIMVILLAVLAMIVVKALAESPWGTFTVAATIPIAILMGLYARFVRPGKIGEVSILGFILLMAAIIGGGQINEHPGLGPGLHLHRHPADLDADRLRLHRLDPAGLAPARPARLSIDLPQDRHHHRPRARHRRRRPAPADAGHDEVRGRHRPGLGRLPVPVSCSSPSRAAQSLASMR